MAGGSPFQLFTKSTVPQNFIRQPLPFVCEALRLDNFTNQWFQQVESGLFVPPYYTDRIISPLSVDQITLVDQAPPGYVQASLIAGQLLQVVPYDFAQSASPGVYQPPIGGILPPNQMLVNMNVGATDSPLTQTLNIPPNMQGIGLYFVQGGVGVSTFQIKSLPSNTVLGTSTVGSAPATGQYYEIVPPESMIPTDSQLSFTVTNGPVGVSQFVAWIIQGATLAVTDPNFPLAVTAAAAGLPVQSGSSMLATRGANRVIAFPVALGMTQATATELIVGVGGKSTRLYGIGVTFDVLSVAGKAVYFLDAAHGNPGAGVVIDQMNQAVQPTGPHQFFGAALSPGNSLYAFADFAATTRGYIAYDQSFA